ncbi:PREDICTED: aquaporin-like [Eufriesea mexicana]|uniref:aquaporin-like n=1 Tax=Eufriesea mexicana TaxID=516756 RepID=UPI00083BEA99|nr:PREDICTED: aquaporin-like [Eufriesea mexicana]XP_017760334.1 PREDICTED: aquaporin-like [Eufriesea mexicana]
MDPGVSETPANGIADNEAGKPKDVNIMMANINIQAAKEKLKSSWLSNLMMEDATGWETLIIALAEVIGTAILVFIGCTGCIGSLGVNPSVFQLSLTFGLAVMIAVQSIGHVSGAHINPSITVAALILGKKSLPMSILYIGAQCFGGLIGYGLLRLITPVELIYGSNPDTALSFCMTDIHENLSTFQGVMTEFIATAILVLFACGIWDCRNSKNTDSVSMRFGFCVAALCTIFVPYTGCSLNPARTLGPAVWNGYWTNHWVFWIGPISGAIVASLFYRCLFHCKRIETDSGQRE